MLQWGDLFTARQKIALEALQHITVRKTNESPALQALTLVFSRSANAGSSLCRWTVTRENHEGVYSRQALPIVWDFSEGNPLSAATGGYSGALQWVISVVQEWPRSGNGQVLLQDASGSSLPTESATVWLTDPPYYDAIPYSDLSDFFFVWLKRALPNHPLLRDPFDPNNPLTPKTREAVQNEHSLSEDGRPKDRAFYEEAMSHAFAEGRCVLKEDGIGSVVFAHKTTEGWEALLTGMIRGGWTITGSWPIATERSTRLRARESAALATSIHLVCRPRPEDAHIGDWGEVLRDLPRRVGEWMDRLQKERIRGADLVFACIGPALEIFSRHPRVETPEGREVGLAEFLEKVWEVVGRSALQQVLGSADAQARNGAAGALEEDARLTALFLWTLQSTEGEGNGAAVEAEAEDEDLDDEEESPPRKVKGYTLVFEVVRRFAQPLGIHLPDSEGRIIETRKGVVRLLPVAERAKQLFGEEGAHPEVSKGAADRLAHGAAGNIQLALFPEAERLAIGGRRRSTPRVAGGDAALDTSREATTLDRVHAAMLLQLAGRANALRALLKGEQERGPEFLRLANAFSALYPRQSEEKRLLDAMLLAVPR
jgi:hypothetical protein